jgi:Asp-tRNA(Asn)/Glu-tRNA(Gln) amidotransferase A subunit family amidase
MADPTLLTIDDWIAASGRDASPREPLLALQRRLETESPPGVWIALVDRAGIESQVASLEVRAARCSDAAALRRTMPLFGVPFAVKDNIDVAGLATTAACPAFRYVAAAHAHAVEKLIAAGAVCVGKTNLDQFATGLVGTRSPYGRPSSVFAAERISGGSSSGSALVVARGDVPFALGTDTAGSGRIPAAFNNIVGLKPTPGRVSTRGVVPACRSIDCVSILALSVADAARVLALVEGSDDGDAYSDFSPGRRKPAPRCASASRRRRSSMATPATARPTSAPSRRCASSATRSCRSTSRRSMRSPSSSTRDLGWQSGTPSSRPARSSSRGDRADRAHRHRRRARDDRDRCLSRPLRIARGAARHALDLGTRRPADDAERARPSAP